MAERKEYIAKNRIRRAGKIYQPGDPIQLTDKEATDIAGSIVFAGDVSSEDLADSIQENKVLKKNQATMLEQLNLVRAQLEEAKAENKKLKEEMKDDKKTIKGFVEQNKNLEKDYNDLQTNVEELTEKNNVLSGEVVALKKKLQGK